MNGAVITALNEAGTIAELVYQLQKQGLDVCVINDGSTDDTGIVARLAGAHVIHHAKPQGIGKSLIEAWRYAIAQGWKYTVQIDAGNSHRSTDAIAMIQVRADVVIGSRFMPTSRYIGRGWRATCSKITAGMCNFATHKSITDWTSGYRVFSLNALRVLSSENYMTNMHAWQIEVLHAAIKNELNIAQTPITYRAGNSSLKLETLDDLIKVYLWLLFV
jgi:glycosyltransferase involved in cell wall biosynthesis